MSLKFTKLKKKLPRYYERHFSLSRNENYNLRVGTHLALRKTRTRFFGKRMVSNLEATVWSLLPEELKNSLFLQLFKNKLKGWKPTNCSCRLCKAYIQHVGFIQPTCKTLFGT